MKTALFTIIFLMANSALTATETAPLIQTSASLYLGQKLDLDILLPNITPNETTWNVDNSSLLELDGGELISIQPQATESGIKIQIAAPYISPSFTNKKVIITGRDINSEVSNTVIELDLNVRAELVIRFKKRDIDSFSSIIPSEQTDSPFFWDLPIDPESGNYQNITVNNHQRGLWVRFRYEDSSDIELLRSGGYLIHIYRGEGEYIVHQPFNRDTHLNQSNCPLEPISEEEWQNPSTGLDASGKAWSNCEFRGFVPEGLAYGFGFREHYLESEENKKRVEIKNTGELNTELIEYYQFLEESGLMDPLSALCQGWK